jgi:hypothetical protein
VSHFGVTPLSTAKNLQPADSPRRGEHSHQVWRRKLERLIFGEFSKIPEVVCRKRVSDRPQKLQIVISPERLEISRPNFNQMFDASLSTFQPISVSIASRPIFGEFLTGFRDFLNANNSETAEASPLKLRLLRGSPRRYEPAKSELL